MQKILEVCKETENSELPRYNRPPAQKMIYLGKQAVTQPVAVQMLPA